MRIIAGTLLYLIIAMLITISIWCDDESIRKTNFLDAFKLANLTILIAIGFFSICLVLLRILFTGTI